MSRGTRFQTNAVKAGASAVTCSDQDKKLCRGLSGNVVSFAVLWHNYLLDSYMTSVINLATSGKPLATNGKPVATSGKPWRQQGRGCMHQLLSVPSMVWLLSGLFHRSNLAAQPTMHQL